MTIPDGVSFDELNKLYAREKVGQLRSMPFNQYFGEMELSEEQIKRRIQTAKDVKEFMLIALAEMYYMRGEVGGLYNPSASDYIRDEYRSMLERLGIPLTAMFLALQPESIATEISGATASHPDDAYFFSDDRATLIAENEANSIWNNSEFQDAMLTGKTRKRWNAINDKKTRDTHMRVNGTTIPIGEYFIVGNTLLMYPKGPCDNPEEVVNCRCSITYS